MNGGVGPAEKSLHIVDGLLFGAVLIVSTGIGIYHALSGGKQKTTSEYFMGDRKLTTIPVSLSILVSFVSAILVLGIPAEMYSRGTELTMRVLGACLSVILSSIFLVPLMYPLKITSSFEYLQRRYRSNLVKLMGSYMMLIGNVFYMGLLMYSPSTALEAVSPFPFWCTVVVTGFVSTLYTAVGGMRAVIWTDAFQAVVMILGMLAVVIQGTILVGGVNRVFEVSRQGGRLSFFNFNPDPTQRLSFWSLVIGGAFSTLTIFGIGQNSVQRYSALPTLKQAKRSVYLNIPGLVIINILASMVGLVMYAYYASVKCDPLKQGYISNANQLLPYFVIDVLNFPGLPGLFLAVLFSGSLSSMSSSLNGCAAVTWEDILRPWCSHWTERHKMWLNKMLVVAYGAVAICVAFLADRLGGHVLQASISFTGATIGPTLGVFLLGALSRKANAVGAVFGFVSATVVCLWMAIGTFIKKPYSHTTLLTSTENCLNPELSLNENSANFTSEFETMVYNGDAITPGFTHVDMKSRESGNISSRGRMYSNFMDGETEIQGRVQNFTSEDFFSQSSTLGSIIELDSDSSSSVSAFYRVSFLWYACIGCMISIIVGLLVSCVTDKWYRKRFGDFIVEDELLIPLGKRAAECLPRCLRHRMMCSTRKSTTSSVVYSNADSNHVRGDNKILDEETVAVFVDQEQEVVRKFATNTTEPANNAADEIMLKKEEAVSTAL